MTTSQTPILLLILLISIFHENNLLASSSSSSSFSLPSPRKNPVVDNETMYKISKKLCINCLGEAIQFLYAQNLIRAAKFELPLLWDSQLEQYAKWWAGERQADCFLMHSFPEDDFKLGENLYWGSGSTWTPSDAVKAWADEEKYYSYKENSCAIGQECGHYTQIVWKNTSHVGCARVVCQSGDVLMTCNYYPPGNYVGERPY